MTPEQKVQLDNAARLAEQLFVEAAERQRAHAAWKRGEGPSLSPSGVETSARLAREAVDDFRRVAVDIGVALPKATRPPAAPDEPQGLGKDLTALFRQFAVQRGVLGKRL